jgi:peroxiredoxin
MVALGTPAPDFSLPDSVSGSIISLSGVRGVRGTVIFFICNHCPYVKHVNAELVRIGRDYSPKGIGFAAISSNDVLRYPEDSPAEMKRVARALGYPFPYLYDESQSVARAYDAACTPDTFVFDGSSRLVYRGQLDDSRPSNGIPVTGSDLRGALDALLAGNPVSPYQKPGVGCSIKWK